MTRPGDRTGPSQSAEEGSSGGLRRRQKPSGTGGGPGARLPGIKGVPSAFRDNSDKSGAPCPVMSSPGSFRFSCSSPSISRCAAPHFSGLGKCPRRVHRKRDAHA
ncbi:hypothetical protein AAFF_G00092160 [Aldrovandia affinis]|uniref:Uncharacterized protein n=1 Tax=Aldrovandia affinis TaxID=143900 RepID=A0AAD7WY15_9TELE|nr:hypothetical protein AAFF_G00092160 [Aldrovandia affinis]